MTPASRRLALSRTALVVSCAVALTMAPGADAGSRLNVSTLAKVAGRSPFPASCSAGFAEYHHAESEVSLAVDPTNGRHLIATYHQDANVAHPVSRSVDGGRTWRQVVVPGLTPCSVPKGEKAPAYNVFDPWVTYGADGRAYLLSVSGTEPGSPGATVAEAAGQQDPFAKHVYVQTSDDDGLTWSAPVVVAGDVDNGFLIDKPTITADPFRPGRAHAVWSRVNLTGSAVMGVATTVDGGRTWSARTLPLTTLDTRGVTFGGQIVVQRDGMLVMTFAEGMAQPLFIAGTLARNASGVDSIPSFIGNARFYSITSADGGATWATRGQLIGSSQTFPGLITVASAGAAIHATWADLSADGIGRVQVSRSLDNGATWSPPLTLAGPGPGVDVPAVAVDGKGTVAVTWYAAGPAPRTVQSVAAVSTDAGVTWTKAALSRAFSVASAPPTNAAGGTQLGDYEGLAGLPAGGFVSAFTVAGALSRGGPTDVVAVRFGR